MTHDTDMSERRRTILAAAQAAFDAAGYAATTMDEVAAKAGISKGSIYNYFQSKQDLFEQVVGEGLAEDEADIDRLIEAPLPATDKLTQYLDYWFERMERYQRIGGLVLEFWATAARQQADGALAESFHHMYDRWVQRLARIVDQGVEAGEFRPELDGHVAGRLIMASMDGITVHAILGMGGSFDERFLAALKRGMLVSLSGGTDRQDPREPRA